MRTDEEILAKMKAAENSGDIFGAIQSDLIDFLPYDLAKPFLNDDVTADQWAPFQKARDRETIIGAIREYMSFAWGKANDCRGLSANRSIFHMQAWLWMLGEEQAGDALFTEYRFYGKPQLRAICEHFGIDWRALDNGHWTNDEGDDGVPAEEVPAITLPWRTEASAV